MVSFDYDKPLYKKGDKFYKGDFEYKILGTKECIADYSTGRKGICYVVKDNKTKCDYTVPCWYLEKNNQKFGYRKK